MTPATLPAQYADAHAEPDALLNFPANEVGAAS